MPTLKIPPINSQEESVIANTKTKSQAAENCFMSYIFYTHAKVLPHVPFNSN